MLPPLVQAHANHQAMFLLAPHQCLAPPDDEVVEQHRADHGEYHAEIQPADPAHGDAAAIGGKGRVHVHLTERKFLGDSRMALSTGLHQVGAIDRGARVARGQNIVHAMTTGAIGDDLRSKF